MTQKIDEGGAVFGSEAGECGCFVKKLHHDPIHADKKRGADEQAAAGILRTPPHLIDVRDARIATATPSAGSFQHNV
jgi:hypothetical protein